MSRLNTRLDSKWLFTFVWGWHVEPTYVLHAAKASTRVQKSNSASYNVENNEWHSNSSIALPRSVSSWFFCFGFRMFDEWTCSWADSLENSFRPTDGSLSSYLWFHRRLLIARLNKLSRNGVYQRWNPSTVISDAKPLAFFVFAIVDDGRI